MLRSNLSEDLLEYLAVKSGFKVRSSKITPLVFMDLLLYSASLNSDTYTLSQMGSYSFGTLGVRISKQSIDNRFNASAQSFVKAVLSHLIKNYISVPLEPSFFSHFARVRIKDSTKFILPDFLADYYKGNGGTVHTSRAGISIQFEYDIKTSSITDLSLTDGRRNDITDAKETLDDILADDLLIRDLGYCSLGVMESVKARGAFFLFRLMPSTTVLDGNGKKMDFKKIYRKMKKNGLPCMEVKAFVGARNKMEVRLSITVVSDEIYNRRLDRLEKSNKRRKDKTSEESKIRLRLTMFITNVPQEILSAKDMQDLYHLRWQVELIFKQWKSTCGINKIPLFKAHRYLCMLYAKLILILLHMGVTHILSGYLYHKQRKLLSTHKCMKTLWSYFKELRSLIMEERSNKAYKSLHMLIEKVSVGHWLEKKNKKLSYMDLFEHFSN